MKDLDQQNHYEVLEVSPGASSEEVERAYRVMQGTYEGGSLATYSVFDPSDTRAIAERVEAAYQILSDEAARAEYDDSMGIDSGKREVELADVVTRSSGNEVVESEGTIDSPFDEFEDDVETEAHGYDGAWLRRTRMRRGIEIEEISEITKISSTYLNCIEEEKLQDLPAEVYARGFVIAYATTLGINPEGIVPHFLEKYREVRSAPRKLFSFGVT